MFITILRKLPTHNVIVRRYCAQDNGIVQLDWFYTVLDVSRGEVFNEILLKKKTEVF